MKLAAFVLRNRLVSTRELKESMAISVMISGKFFDTPLFST